MANLTVPRNTIQLSDRPIIDFVAVPVAAAVILQQGAMVAVNLSGGANAGFAQKVIVPTPSGGLVIIGRIEKTLDNTAGIAGALTANVHQGNFKWDNGAGADALTNADMGMPCWASDDHTVNRTDSAGTRPFAGTVVWVDTDGVWVEQRMTGRQGGAQIFQFAVDLASVAAGVYTSFKPGFAGRISRFEFNTGKAAVTAAKLATLQPRITPSGGVAAVVTGGILNLTTANAIVGAPVTSTTITALNSFGPADTIDLFGSAVTAFVEGSGTLSLYIG